MKAPISGSTEPSDTDDERHAYEVEGLEDTGEVCPVEILGYQTEAEALVLAQRYADMWQVTVNLTACLSSTLALRRGATSRCSLSDSFPQPALRQA